MKILITGGAGFIGSAVVRHIINKTNDSVVNVDKLTYAGNLESLLSVSSSQRYAFELVDICNQAELERVFNQHQPDAVMHLAAESHVDRSIDGPTAFIETNIVGTYTLLEVARKYWQQLDGGRKQNFRFHHISTDEVYGSLGPEDPAFSETTQYQPNSPYSASKASSDHLVRAYHHTYGLEVTTSNCSNNYGPYQYPEKLIPLFLLNALHGRDLPIYGDGRNVRDWLHVEDHCRGIEACLAKGIPGQTYNIGGGAELPNMEVIDRICTEVDRALAEIEGLADRYPDAPAAKGRATNTLKTFVADRAGHDRRYAIDESKAVRELGYSPSRSFAEGFAETVNWYLTNEPWWRSVMDGSYRDWVDLNYERRSV